MANAVGCLAIAAAYGLFVFALSPWLSRYSVFLVGAAFLFSLITFIWVQSIFQCDDYAEIPARQGKLSDLRFSLPAALEIPISCLATALSITWLLEQRIQFGLVALLVAAAMWLLVLRAWFRRETEFRFRRRRNNVL
jgi:hypothetical protein